MKPIYGARLRLTSLWVSQTARILADNALRVFVLVQVAASAAGGKDFAWHLVAALVTLPGVFLAPLNGAICNSLPRNWVLAGASIYCGSMVLIFGLLGENWALGWGLLAIGAAIYSPARYAILPAAAADTHIPLTRVNGWIEMGSVAGIAGGFAIGLAIEQTSVAGWPAAVVGALALNLLGALAGTAVVFPSDIRRPESPKQALLGFFRDCNRIWSDGIARSALLGMAVLRALVIASTGALIATVLHGQAGEVETLDSFRQIAPWIVVGAAAGSVLAGIQRHMMRALGLVPPCATIVALALALAAWTDPTPFICFVIGGLCAVINVPLAAVYQAYVPPDARGNAMAIRNFTDYVLMSAASLLFFGLSTAGWINEAGQLALAAVLTGAAAVWAWKKLFRLAIEQVVEWIVWPIYRIHVHGAVDAIPLRGPVLIVANHSAWMDPIWLAKAMPRKLFPMMTSSFYDLRGMRWLMKHVAQAIRVQDSTYRRQAPELQEAIAYLDRGRAVVIFPEGSLRRSETRPLRRFGQGVWHILEARPDTPVVTCWIEGGWGSFFSYFQGRPTRNKRFDFWRRIDVAVSEPFVIPPDLLSNLTAMRTLLEQRCGQARATLGLDAFQPDSSRASKRV